MLRQARKAFFSAAAFGMLASATHAAVITYDLSVEYSGATPPAGQAPWLRATFDDGGGSGSVMLTLETPGLVGSEFVRTWLFNLDPALDPDDLDFSAPTKIGTFADPVIETEEDAFPAGGDGIYDIRFNFDNAPPADRFGAGDSVMYTISGIPSLTANSFDFLSTPAGGNGPFKTAAHVQGIAPDGQESGWVTVPEPASLGLTAALVIGLRRRVRRAHHVS